jgi:hypothetical protein
MFNEIPPEVIMIIVNRAIRDILFVDKKYALLKFLPLVSKQFMDMSAISILDIFGIKLKSQENVCDFGMKLFKYIVLLSKKTPQFNLYNDAQLTRISNDGNYQHRKNNQVLDRVIKSACCSNCIILALLSRVTSSVFSDNYCEGTGINFSISMHCPSNQIELGSSYDYAVATIKEYRIGSIIINIPKMTYSYELEMDNDKHVVSIRDFEFKRPHDSVFREEFRVIRVSISLEDIISPNFIDKITSVKWNENSAATGMWRKILPNNTVYE